MLFNLSTARWVRFFLRKKFGWIKLKDTNWPFLLLFVWMNKYTFALFILWWTCENFWFIQFYFPAKIVSSIFGLEIDICFQRYSPWSLTDLKICLITIGCHWWIRANWNLPLNLFSKVFWMKSTIIEWKHSL